MRCANVDHYGTLLSGSDIPSCYNNKTVLLICHRDIFTFIPGK